MNYNDVKSRLWSNTLSNYLRTVIATIVGLVTFRLLYQSLSREEFGFWVLLWSVFGYGVLLDFGLGFAAQKRVAELSVHRDWPELSRVLSSILALYSGIAVVIAGVVWIGSPWMVKWFHVSAENETAFRWLLVLFFTGVGLAFPMGLFPEILRGQQRIRLANHLISAALVLRLILIGAAVFWGWGFLWIMVIALVLALAPDVLAAFFALRSMPGVRLHPRHISWHSMKQTAGFSVFAYISTATNLILGKTDQLLIGATLGVGAVAVYQAGARVADVFSQFTRQIQDALSPAAAHLHASADRAALRDLLVQSLRWSVLLATPLYLLSAFHLDDLLRLLTGEDAVPAAMFWTGQVLLGWFYTTLLTHSVSKRIFMMTGHHRRLMKLGTVEAVANVALSLTLVLVFKSVVAVAVGSLLPTLFIGWVHLWPWIARERGLTPVSLLQRAVLPVLVACIPMLLVQVTAQQLGIFNGNHALVRVTIEGGAAGAVGALCLWRWVLGGHERAFILRRLPFLGRFGSMTAPSPTTQPA